jgi:hypothetical protein
VRVLEVSPRFGASQRHHAPEGSLEWRAVLDVLAQLTDDRLPLPGANDVKDVLAPAMPCLARPIPAAGLLVCYALRDDVVYVLAVKRSR